MNGRDSLNHQLHSTGQKNESKLLKKLRKPAENTDLVATELSTSRTLLALGEWRWQGMQN